MNSSVFRISLDIHETNSQVALRVKKGDTARRIIIALTESGKPYRIAKDCSAVFTAKKADGNILFNSCTIDGNRIEYTLSPQSTAVSGEMPCEMRLYGADSALITSPRFVIFVDDTVYSDGDVVESSNEFSELTKLLSQIRALKGALEDLSKLEEDYEWLFHDVDTYKQKLDALVERVVLIEEDFATLENLQKLEEIVFELCEDVNELQAALDSILGSEGHLENIYEEIDDLKNEKKGLGLSVVDGKICCNAIEVGGDGWKQVEPAAAIDAPYLKEYGYSLAKQDGTAELYEWIYRCVKEGFSVPYRTIEVDGVEHSFETELTKYDKAWADRFVAGDPEFSLQVLGVTRDDASFLCIPLIQFGIKADKAVRVFERVRNDNPELCCPPLNGAFMLVENDLVTYAFVVFQSEETVAEIQSLIEKASGEIDAQVQALSETPNTSAWREAVALIIHDYIVTNANPTVEGAAGNRMIAPWKASAYSVLDKEQQALCDGYTQAFNLFARKYGIVSIVMTGSVYKNGAYAGDHAWNAVNLYETYDTVFDGEKWLETEPDNWSPIDVYWDEPLHETAAIGGTVEGSPDVLHKYFGSPGNVNCTTGTLNGVSVTWTREHTTTTGYGEYPFDGTPSAEI